MNTELFKEAIDLFVQKRWRQRLKELLATPKRHGQLLNEFHTSQIFDATCLREIPGAEQNSEGIYGIMTGLGSEDTCYDLFELLDGMIEPINLKWALEESVGFLNETLLYCPNSRLGYFEGGHAKDRFVLVQKKR